MRSIPLITANPYPAASSKEEATAGGQRRGKPSAALERYGPVTTDPFGERLQSCHNGKSMAGATRGLLVDERTKMKA